MNAIPMNREWARAAGFDAAEDSRKKAGRTTWSRADYNRACREFNRLWPVELDQRMAPMPTRRTFTTTILRRPW